MGEAVARAQRGALSGRGRTSALRSMRHPGEAVGGRGIGEGDVGGPEKRTLLALQQTHGVPGHAISSPWRLQRGGWAGQVYFPPLAIPML